MKRGKDEEKVLEPMFPRLHVNDADKGGPRAPPRNKMALYEQLSIPSQRFGDHGTLPHNSRNNITTLIPPGPSYQSCGVERNSSAQSLDSSAAANASEKFVSQMPFMENVKSLPRHHQRKMVREEEDFAVPVFVNSRRSQCYGRTRSGIEKEKHTPLVAPSSRHSIQYQEVNHGGSKQNDCLATCSKPEVRDQVKVNSKSGGFIISLDLSVREEVDLEKSASSCDRVNDSNDQDGEETRVNDIDNGVESHLATEDHSEEGRGSPDDVDTGREYCRSGGYTSLQQINGEASDDVSDSSMVDSISSIDVSPDEVVGVLGQKRFWRARKAIANREGHFLLTYMCKVAAETVHGFILCLLCICQQRVFAVQLFELHRLVKVQKLIAASPDVLLDEINYLRKVKSYPVKKLIPSEFMVKPPLPQVVVKHRSDSEKTDQHKMESSAENVVGRLPNQGQHQPSNYMPFVSNPQASPAANGYCFPPQPPPSGNQQWLIPVMSPSEGLIYKPHPGMGQPAPVCGGYYGHYMPTPIAMPQFHPGMGFPPPGNGYFPPYGMMPTMMNPYYSGQQQQQPNEQMNQYGHSGNFQNVQQQSSVNEPAVQQHITKPSPRARKSRQGSTGSSPSVPTEGISPSKSFRPFLAVDEDSNINNSPEDMMTTTTTTTRTTVTQTTRDGGVTRVIKVVPHNAKLASENAARIFRSIQEERKRQESYCNT